MKNIMFLAALLGSALIAQNRSLENGFYAIQQDTVKGTGSVTRHSDGKDLVLDTASFAPLTVKGKPEVNRSVRRSSLRIQLAPDAAKRLEELTRSHMNEPIAVVVDNKILSAPTVRSIIKDGKASLTPCQDPSCETLLRELGK
jgi:preprotein translocase subunit SecD